MGSVWKAQHVELSTSAAVKLIDPLMADSDEALVRFKREAQAAATLRSPHVVLLDQVLDHLLLAAIHPTGDGRDAELEDEGVHPGQHSAAAVRVDLSMESFEKDVDSGPAEF